MTVKSIKERDEQSPETPSTDESGLGNSLDLRSDSDDSSEDDKCQAALVVPPDGGWGWVVVAASFMCNFFIDGIIFSGGMLLPSIKEEFGVSDGAVAPVNSLLAGCYLLFGPFVSGLANKFGFRMVTIVGSVIGSAAFALSYFAPNVEYLYVVYGIVGGIGFCMIYMPSVLTVGFYFEKWRALATGLALCGSGVGTFVFAPLTNLLIEQIGWRHTLLVLSCLILICIICGSLFRPIEPTRVTLSEAVEDEEDASRRHEEAVEKLNSILKLHDNKLDYGITMPQEPRFPINRSGPHTWMGVASNTRYPTAEEVFRGGFVSRRSSANATVIKNSLGNKQLEITPVAEKDEQEDSVVDTTEPLISGPIVNRVRKVHTAATSRRSHTDLVVRPMYRDDIFYEGSLNRLPQYTSRTSLGYHLAVTHILTEEDTKEEEKFGLCSEAVKRTLATMFDISLFKSPTFVLLALSGFFTMLGFFVPYIYVTSRAEKNGMTKSTSMMLVSAIGIANIVGRIICGLVTSMPKVSPLWLNNIALTAGGIATMFSGYCYNEVFQFGYCAVFGLAVACFASLRSILVVEYIGLEQLTNCFGMFLLLQGFGALLGAPIAGYLMDMTNSYDIAFYVSGTFLFLSAVMCYPVDIVNRWEKSRNKLNSGVKA